MIQLLQIMKHMLKTLEYTKLDITDIFTEIENDEYTLIDLYESIGVEPTNSQHDDIEKSFKSWRSALHVSLMTDA